MIRVTSISIDLLAIALVTAISKLYELCIVAILDFKMQDSYISLEAMNSSIFMDSEKETHGSMLNFITTGHGNRLYTIK